MIHSPVVVLDFETTGLRPENGDRITEVGLLRIEGGRITDRYLSLVNCGARIPDSIVAYTGITQQMIDTAPPVSQVMREVAAFIGETAVVAHNAVLDQRFFLRELRHQRIGMVVEPFICTMQLSRRVYPHLRSFSLGELAYRLMLPPTGSAHRAGFDAEVTGALLLQLCRDITAMQPEVMLTPQLLRDLMRVPARQLQTRLERLCA
jgi:DNA polymerase-3 subunit epsilon